MRIRFLIYYNRVSIRAYYGLFDAQDVHSIYYVILEHARYTLFRHKGVFGDCTHVKAMLNMVGDINRDTFLKKGLIIN